MTTIILVAKVLLAIWVAFSSAFTIWGITMGLKVTDTREGDELIDVVERIFEKNKNGEY